ncbi:MAG: Superoxide dismutase [Mn], partial [uncultured Rubrobacteraceae bacterium]
GIRAAAAPLRLRRPGAHDRRADHAPPPREAPQHLRDQPQRRPGEAPRGRPRQHRGAHRKPGLRARRHKDRGQEQRRRPLQPLDVLADHGPQRPGRGHPERRPRAGHRLLVRLVRRVQGAVRRGRGPRRPVRLRVGLAYSRPRRLPLHREDGQPGLAADGGQDAHPGPGRVGARLLPQLPEPPPRVHKRLVERRQLGRGRSPLRRRQERL